MVCIKLLFLIFSLVLIYFGFFVKRANWLGWFMFVRGSFCYPNIYNNNIKINIWDYIPHGQVIIHEDMIDKLLNYLREEKRFMDIKGEIILKTNKNKIVLKIKNSLIYSKL